MGLLRTRTAEAAVTAEAADACEAILLPLLPPSRRRASRPRPLHQLVALGLGKPLDGVAQCGPRHPGTMRHQVGGEPARIGAPALAEQPARRLLDQIRPIRLQL